MPEEEKPVGMEDPIIAVFVLKFLEYSKERADPATYMADPERKELLDALCDYTGVSPNGTLAKHFLTYIDGIEAGMEMHERMISK